MLLCVCVAATLAKQTTEDDVAWAVSVGRVCAARESLSSPLRGATSVGEAEEHAGLLGGGMTAPPALPAALRLLLRLLVIQGKARWRMWDKGAL